jgi:transcriptional regulator with XRE-family HTH domain
MAAPKDVREMQARNAEIGRILEEARARQNISMAELAAAANITRQFYSAIAKGSAYGTAVQIERLIRYLRIPPEAIWHDEGEEERPVRDVPVQVRPGERVRVVIDVLEIE